MNPVAELITQTSYGKLCFQVYLLDTHRAAVRVWGDWIDEWAGDDGVDEIWEELNSWTYEDPEEFPDGLEAWLQYLEFCSDDIVRRFSNQISAAAAKLQQTAKSWMNQHHSVPSEKWLYDHYPTIHFTAASDKFKHRIITAVLPSLGQPSLQLSLF